jgi:hypothetical protein
VNQGPSYDEIRTQTQQPIERLRLEREVNINVNVGEPRPVVRGQAIVIPAPLIARGQAIERPRRVKETITNVVVDRGWENTGDRQTTEKVRVKMKAEATPPPNAPPKNVCETSGGCRGNIDDIGNIDIYDDDGRTIRKRDFNFDSGEFCNRCGDRHTNPSREARDDRPSDCDSISNSTRDGDTG